MEPNRNPELKFSQIFINNEFVNSVRGKTFPTLNPVTEEKIIDIQAAEKEDVDLAVAAAQEAFKRGSPWRKMGPSARRALLWKLGELIERDMAYIASLDTIDIGKPFNQSVSDVMSGADVMKYYAGFTDKHYGKTIPVDGDMFCYTRNEPIGICGQIIPWNFPAMLFCYKIAPALAAGNVIVMKPAELASLSSLYLASLVKEAGFPPGVVNVVPGYGATAGAAVASHPDIRLVSFTGSTEIGKDIMQAAAKSNLKKISLVLSGKCPLIVMPDANLEQAVAMSHVGLFDNSGQVCISSSRLLVHEDIHDAFVAKAVEMAKKRIVGDPCDMATESGPQVSEAQMNKILGLIESGKAQGAQLQCGGSRIGDKGYFIESTVFSGVTEKMRIFQEEIFGPVMSIIKFKTVDEAIDLANNSSFGLAAGVLTKDVETYLTISNHLEAGTVWVNTCLTLSPAAPFGGYKMSGIGREMGEEGLGEYSQVKSVYVKLPQSAV